MSFTPTDAQAGKTVTATVTVTYSDKSTDAATVTFKVAAKTEPEPKPEPTDPKADLRKEVESASKLDEKDYTADSWKVFAARSITPRPCWRTRTPPRRRSPARSRR